MRRCLTSPTLDANHAGSHALPDSSGTVWKTISAQGGHERDTRVAQRGHVINTGALALVDACRSMQHRVHIHPILRAMLHRIILTIHAGMQLGMYLLSFVRASWQIWYFW